jgi:DNA polymerase (family 10)
LTLYKGFGEKTQKNIKEAIEFYMNSLGSYLYQQIESFAFTVNEKINKTFAPHPFIFTASFRRHMEVIEKLEWVTTVPVRDLKNFFISDGFDITEESDYYLSVNGKENVTLGFYSCETPQLYNHLFVTSCSEEFLAAWEEQTIWNRNTSYSSEEEIFSSCNSAFIPPFEREKASIIPPAKNNKLPSLIQPADITGIIHCHSKWSDGSNTIEEMAKAAIDKGLQYLVISDHSKSAFYASGLNEQKIIAQHQQIDELNKQLYPFKIFKSIESDILNDGNLDYPDALLSTFDIIIASIHSNLKMNEEKAMLRLMKAIENPFTSILGHMTGRLLLSRNGYPVDHKKVIEACAVNQVVIELNAHPRRLDMDWRWIDYALEKNVLISIDPDAHTIAGYNDCRYGVLIAQKAGLTKEKNLSSFSLPDLETFIAGQQLKRKLSPIIK